MQVDLTKNLIPASISSYESGDSDLFTSIPIFRGLETLLVISVRTQADVNPLKFRQLQLELSNFMADFMEKRK